MNLRFEAFQKVLCALFTLLVLFCAAMTGSYAWRDYAQHKSNEFYGGITTETSSVSPTSPTTTTTATSSASTSTTSSTSTSTSSSTSTSTTSSTSSSPSSSTSTSTSSSSSTSTTSSTSTSTTSTATCTTTTTEPKVPGPVTGDTGNIWLWAALTVVSAIGLRATLLWGKKGGRRKESEA